VRAPRGVGWPDAGLLLAACLWGLNYTTVKVALEQLPPLALGFIRFCLAGALFFVLLAVVEHDVRVAWRDLARLAMMGALSIGANQILFLDGLQHTSAALAAIMFACASAFTILLARQILREHAGWQIWLGILLATMGIALIVGVGASGGTGNWLSEAEVFASSLAVGLAALLAKDLLRRYSALRVTAWTSLFGLCCMAPFAIGTLPTVSWTTVHVQTWAALGFTAIGASVVTLQLWYAGIAHVGVTRATVYSYLQPILGVVFAALLLGDRLTASQLAGGVVALVGTWLAGMATLSHVVPAVALPSPSADAAPAGADFGSLHRPAGE
jgi:drug/metabolite transporter (DMT)-like permease